MLPEIKAVAVEPMPLEGGSTRPFIMDAVDEKGERAGKWVVKIFKESHREAARKEVYGNWLAQEFDLAVPRAALIEVDAEMLRLVKKPALLGNDSYRAGHFFAVEYLQNAFPFSAALAQRKLELWEMETIFAFDALIRNTDRTERKPNMILHQKRPHLIDHELALEIQKPFESYFEAEGWAFLKNARTERNHLFLTFLRKKNRKKPLDFATFFELLRNLRPEKIFPFGDQLIELGFDATDLGPIVAYLKAAKNDPDRLKKTLNDLLQ